MITKKQAKGRFIGLSARGIPGTVGVLGEDIAASLIRGDRVSDHSVDTPFADVVNTDVYTAVEAKMANCRHAHRPTPSQIAKLFRAVVETPFLFDKGVYVLIFYGGVHERRKGSNKALWGKSMIWSRKNSRTMRREIICRELQYIYIFDVRLAHYIAINCPEMIRKGTIVYDPLVKPGRESVLYLNRTFMAGFPKKRESHLTLLNEALGERRWAIKSTTQEFLFVNGSNGSFSREIPVHVIGSRRTVNAIMPLFRKPIAPVHLGHNNAPKML